MKIRFFAYLGAGTIAEETVEYGDDVNDETILQDFTPWLEGVTRAGWEVIEEVEP